MGRIAWTARDAHKAMAKERGWRFKIMGLMLRYQLDLRWRRKTRMDRRAGLGSALVCSLRRSLMDRNVPLWLKTDFQELVQEGGRVSGIVVDQGGQRRTLTARKGVIFGAGGFEQNQQLREKYLPDPTRNSWSATPPGCNTGAALIAGQAPARPPTCWNGAGGRPPSPCPRKKNPAACLPSGPSRAPSWSMAWAGASSTRRRPTSSSWTPCTRTTPPPAAVRSRPG
jgi:3-oxosteroid 1-dehydrogenase